MQILRGLYLGNVDKASNIDFFKSKQITHVVNCSEEIPNYFEKNRSISYCSVGVINSEETDILSSFSKSNIFIKKALDQGNGVLVHCKYGMSRSPSFVLAYLMYNGLTCDKAYRKLKGQMNKKNLRMMNTYFQQLLEYNLALYPDDESNERGMDNFTQRDELKNSISFKNQDIAGNLGTEFAYESEDEDIQEYILNSKGFFVPKEDIKKKIIKVKRRKNLNRLVIENVSLDTSKSLDGSYWKPASGRRKRKPKQNDLSFFLTPPVDILDERRNVNVNLLTPNIDVEEIKSTVEVKVKRVVKKIDSVPQTSPTSPKKQKSIMEYVKKKKNKYVNTSKSKSRFKREKKEKIRNGNGRRKKKKKDTGENGLSIRLPLNELDGTYWSLTTGGRKRNVVNYSKEKIVKMFYQKPKRKRSRKKKVQNNIVVEIKRREMVVEKNTVPFQEKNVNFQKPSFIDVRLCDALDGNYWTVSSSKRKRKRRIFYGFNEKIVTGNKRLRNLDSKDQKRRKKK